MNSYLEKYLEEKRDEILKVLADFIAIPSVSDDAQNVRAALRFALDIGTKLGFDSKSVLDDGVGIIEVGQGEENLGILAHVDVVSPGEAEEWNTPPFEAVIEDGKIYGRGTLDDKGMVVASLYAMKAVASLDLPFKKKVSLILGTQEEVEWTDMEAYVKKYPLPDYGFTPDGEYPICNIEKGNGDITMEFDVKDSEDGGKKLSVREIVSGVANNIVPGKAKAILSNGETVSASGKQVHSCQPERGENALFKLCDELSKMDLEDNKLLRLLKEIKICFSDIFGEKLGLYSESEYYEGEFVHRNAFSPTIFISDKGKVKLNVNIRFAYGQSFEEIEDRFREWAQENGGQIISATSTPAVFVSKDRPFLGVLAEAYEDVSGLKNEYTLAYGGSYAKAMPNVVSWAPIFPGEEDTCHEPNEYIGVESLMTSAKIFAEAIAKIALSEKSFK